MCEVSAFSKASSDISYGKRAFKNLVSGVGTIFADSSLFRARYIFGEVSKLPLFSFPPFLLLALLFDLCVVFILISLYLVERKLTRRPVTSRLAL